MRALIGSAVLALVATVATAGCDSLADGEVVVSLDTRASEQAFADDWEVSFSRVLVSVGDLEIAKSDGEVGARSAATYVVDLAQGAADIELIESLTTERWDAVSFSTRPPGDGPVKAFGAGDDDVSMLREGGYSHWIEGAASKGERTVTFAWGIAAPSTYTACTLGAEMEPGLTVAKGGTTSLPLTFHRDHLFFDTLGLEDGPLRFDAIAAVGDADGVVAWGALADQGLAALQDENGEPLTDINGPVLYDTRDVVLAREDLQRFMLAGLEAAVHVGADGDCVAAPL